jgi:hypothetical protein
VRVLLDESLPIELAVELAGTTVAARGWSGLTNGELLRRATEAGFDVFVTADQSLPHQQNLEGAAIAVVVVRARTNRIQDLLPLLPDLRRALEEVGPGQVLRVGG